MSIFNMYTAKELREHVSKPPEQWAEDFILYIQDIIASELLDEWLESHSEDEYIERVKKLTEDIAECIEGDDEDI